MTKGSFGFLTQQIKGVHKDLLTFQLKTTQRFDGIDGRLDRMDGRLDRVDGGLRGLREAMPKIVGDSVRDVLRGQNGKSRRKR